MMMNGIEVTGLMKPPVGKDGLCIKPGQTVYGEDGKAWRIDAVGTYFVWSGLSKGETAKRLRPEWLTHTEPDSWSKLMRDASAQPFAYCATHGLLGEEAPTNEKFARDLVRRAKRLAEADADFEPQRTCSYERDEQADCWRCSECREPEPVGGARYCPSCGAMVVEP